MIRHAMAVALAALWAGTALAEIDTMPIQDGLAQQGFGDIVIAEGDEAITVTALRDDLAVEIVYDADTGAILSDESRRLDETELAALDDTAAGDEATDPVAAPTEAEAEDSDTAGDDLAGGDDGAEGDEDAVGDDAAEAPAAPGTQRGNARSAEASEYGRSRASERSGGRSDAGSGNRDRKGGSDSKDRGRDSGGGAGKGNSGKGNSGKGGGNSRD